MSRQPLARRDRRSWTRDVRSVETRHRLEDTLGPDSPLIRACARTERIADQGVAAGLLTAIGAVSMASGEPWAPALLLSSSAVLVAYGVSFVPALAERRERLIELIAGGHGQLVPTAGEQLLAPGRRRMLARSLGRLLDAAASPASPQRATIPRNRSTILACSPELREISEILRADRVASAQPVALCDLLISRAGSPLYRADPECLRQELGRIRYLLTPSASEPSLPERNR